MGNYMRNDFYMISVREFKKRIFMNKIQLTKLLCNGYSLLFSCSVMSDSFETPQAPLSLEFSRQECWSGEPLLSPGYLPDPGIKPMSPALVGSFFTV